MLFQQYFRYVTTTIYLNQVPGCHNQYCTYPFFANNGAHLQTKVLGIFCHNECEDDIWYHVLVAYTPTYQLCTYERNIREIWCWYVPPYYKLLIVNKTLTMSAQCPSSLRPIGISIFIIILVPIFGWRIQFIKQNMEGETWLQILKQRYLQIQRVEK